MPQIAETYLPLIHKTISTLVVLALTLLVQQATRRLVWTRFRDSSHAHTFRMLLRNSVYLVGTIAVLVIWLGGGPNLTVAMGILGAGIAFASQEVIGSFAGYLSIVSGNLFHIGDRVLIGSVVGDVLDIGMLRTTVMEIGEWVKADQYTGRVVSVANRVVFSDPVFNYTNHWHYLWDELTVPITYGSDWQRAVEIMLEKAQEHSASVQAEAESELQHMMKNYPVHDTPVNPLIYLTLTDNWIQMTVRYVVDVRSRRGVQAKLHLELLQRFESEPRITVASATVEIVGFPPLSGAALQHPQAPSAIPGEG